ncbi:hypothetical protein [Burkholderia sp. BCC1047]|uniref:hypothetical protein n=1 Tax=Burkholderia sp. BCC1047 TaxID=2676299 RepID=UPI00158B83A5|nr:hypothetical protein [Burkholderia sp. BCC1047]
MDGKETNRNGQRDGQWTDSNRGRLRDALKAVSALAELDAAPETQQGIELEMLVIRVEHSGAKLFPIEELRGGRKRLGVPIRQRSERVLSNMA